MGIYVAGKEMFLSLVFVDGSKIFRSFDRRYLASSKPGELPITFTDLLPERTTEVYKIDKAERLATIASHKERQEKILFALVAEKKFVRACIQADPHYFDEYEQDDYDSHELAILFN